MCPYKREAEGDSLAVGGQGDLKMEHRKSRKHYKPRNAALDAGTGENWILPSSPAGSWPCSHHSEARFGDVTSRTVGE